MRRLALCALWLAAVVLLPSASSNHDGPPCEPSTSIADLTVPGSPASASLYLFIDGWDASDPADVTGLRQDPLPWIYEEANGIPGAQRGDQDVDDTCGGLIPSDRIIY